MSSRWSSPCGRCFAATSYQSLFVDYESICRVFPWPLTEVKDLSKREREYWFRVAQDIRTKGNPDSPVDLAVITGGAL